MGFFDNTDYYYRYAVISLTGDEEQVIRDEYMPHFLFYRRIKNDVDFFCTSCTERYLEHKKVFSGASAALRHKEIGVCPMCGEQVQFRAMGLGRKTYQHWENIVLIRAKSENEVLLDCVGIRMFFEDDDMMPLLEAFQKNQYVLRPGEVRRYANKWCWAGGYDWQEIKKISEPNFYALPYGYADNRYFMVGEGNLDGTFLRYAYRCVESLPAETVSYLCKFAQHPNLEYLMRGGFEEIGKAVTKGGCGIYINWKSNDLKKMLRLSKPELKLLQGCEPEQYRCYIELRRRLNLDPDKVFEYYQHFGTADCLRYIYNIKERSGLDDKSIMDYVLKTVKKSKGLRDVQALGDYSDYIAECVRLKYDLKDRTVLFPRDLYKAHQRNISALKVQSNLELERKRDEADKQRNYLTYTDEKRGFTVLIPTSLTEIVTEGRSLNHCVGGYAERHANGMLHILFLRKTDAPNVPFYTMEVDTEGRLIQCRGYANNVVNRGGVPKPQEIKDFEQEYQQYLIKAFKEFKKKKRKKERKSA